MSVGKLAKPRAGKLAAVLVASGIGLSVSAAGSAALASSVSTTTQIRSNWEAFFNAKTPLSKKISLLQNGKAFAKVIREQARSPLSQSASAKVSKVTLHGKSSATVRYTIEIGGQPALKNQTGTAIHQNGTWKVAAVSFCALLHLEGVKVPACTSASG